MTGFVGVADQTGTRVHGLHLETTHLADVSECVWSSADLASARPSSPLCDPRLNPEQTAAVVHAWGEMLARHYRAVETPS
jgi:3-deoxy-7-phosphoheptulonate synthase